MNKSELTERLALTESVKRDTKRLEFLERRHRNWRNERDSLRCLWQLRRVIQNNPHENVERLIELVCDIADVWETDYNDTSFYGSVSGIDLMGWRGDITAGISFSWRGVHIKFSDFQGAVFFNNNQILPVVEPEIDWYTYPNGA